MKAMNRTPYLTDLSDAEWDGIARLFPTPVTRGRPRLYSPREIFNAIVYLLRSGCAWRLLPHDLPPWKTVYHSFRLWQKNGLWERIHTALRERVRVHIGREAQPTAGIIDSQSVKTVGLRGPRGYDDGRENQGTQTTSPGRHGIRFVLKAKVHTADSMDRDGVIFVVDEATTQFPRLRHVWLDAGYNGKGKGKDWIEKTLDGLPRLFSIHPSRTPFGLLKVWSLTGTRLWLNCLPQDFRCYLVDGSSSELSRGLGGIDA